MARSITTLLSLAAVSAGVTGFALAASDRYAAQVPDGIAFAEFRGYETWQVVSLSLARDTFAAILGNPAMIRAYEAGIPGNGQAFPDGARMAKIHWKARQSPDAPDPTMVPGALHDIDFMVKDRSRFAATGGWGYAQFNYDPATESFVPEGRGAACGAACHELAATKDYVFTAYPRR